MLPHHYLLANPVTAIFYLLLSLVVAHLGRKTRIGFWGTFFCCLLITPLPVLFIIILLSCIRMPRS